MKVLSIEKKAIPEIEVIKFQRFKDFRGYFTETFRKSALKDLSPMIPYEFVQGNEGHSWANTFRGFHFQFNPYQGKLVRCIVGRVVEMALDIRKGSPTFGKVVMYEMLGNPNLPYNEWIWVPPGFGHANFFTEETWLEYLCTGEYNQSCSYEISPCAPDLDWGLCDDRLREELNYVLKNGRVTMKDRCGLSLEDFCNKPEVWNPFYYRGEGVVIS